MLLKNVINKTKSLNLFRTAFFNQIRDYQLTVEPQSCAQDIPTSITATGLKPNEEATITVRAKDHKGEEYFSYTHFRANLEGCICLEKHNSLGGSYNGCIPMGWMSSLRHVNRSNKHFGFIIYDSEKPIQLLISLLSGHVDRDRCAKGTDVDCLDSVQHERHFLGEGCRKLIVRYGRLRGNLFLPSGPGPFPGVIDLFGSTGGLKEFRAAQFASNGIAAFSLAFFNYDDLPKEPDVDFHYFESAVQYMLGRKEIIPYGIGAIGTSKGADIVLSMGAYIKEVKAVVAINGVPANALFPMKMNGQLIKGLEFMPNKVKFRDDMIIIKDCFKDLASCPELTIPLEKCDGQIMMVVSTDDQCWYPHREALRIVENMRKLGRSNIEVLSLEGAGHMVNPPFQQIIDCFYHKLFKLYMVGGGTLEAHSKGEQLAWKKINAFFKDNLSNN